MSGISRYRPDSWPSAAEFVAADLLDPVSVGQAVAGADVVAHCELDAGDNRGTRTVLDAMAETGTRRIVFASSAYTDGARTEEMLANSGAQWVVIRCALVIGRSVDDRVRHLLAQPAFAGASVDRPVQVVHLDDALRLLIRAIRDNEMDGSTVELAAPGELTLRRIAKALGWPIVPLPAGWLGAGTFGPRANSWTFRGCVTRGDSHRRGAPTNASRLRARDARAGSPRQAGAIAAVAGARRDGCAGRRCGRGRRGGSQIGRSGGR